MSLQTVNLVVPGYDEGLASFLGKLGFELEEDTPLGKGKCWVVVKLKGGEARLLLAEARGAVQRAAIVKQAGGAGSSWKLMISPVTMQRFLRAASDALSHRAAKAMEPLRFSEVISAISGI